LSTDFSFRQILNRRRVEKIVTALIILLFAALALDVFLLGFAFTRNYRREATCLALLSGTLGIYSLGYALELMAKTSGEAMMALRVENIGIPLVAPFFLLTVLAFFHPRLLRPWMIKVSVFYGVMMAVIVFFNDSHMLYYSSIEMGFNGAFIAARLSRGPFYFIQQAFSTVTMLLAYIMLFVRYIRGPKKLRRQMNLFIVGSLFGFAGNVANFFGAVPMNIDPTPFALSIGLLFSAINLYQHKMMDIVPAAVDNAVENMDDAMIVLDIDWGFVYCNQEAKEIFPALEKFSGTEEIQRVEGWPAELMPNSAAQVVFSVAASPSVKTLHRATITPIVSKQGTVIGFSLTIRDITEITDMLARLEELAITDPLTGVLNRRHFMELVDQHMGIALRHNLSMGLLLLDIDHFKRVNDSYGHLAGDYVLCKVVQVVTNQLRAHDIMARFGGEEFIILSIEDSETDLITFSNRLREAIESELISFEGVDIPITASFGAVLIEPGQSYKGALDAVDRALYTAKRRGRNQAVLGKI